MTKLLQTSKTPSKCSCKGCTNTAVNYLLTKQKTYLCDECFAKLTDEAICLRTPKSPQNVIKRKLDQKREETYD